MAVGTYAANALRTCYAERCHVSSLPTPHRQAPFVPSGPPGLRGTHLRFAAPHPLQPVIHKVHLALLRVTPQAPRNGGMYAALRAKEEIVHPASIVDPSTPSGQLRFTLSAPGLLIQPPSQILLCQARCGCRQLPPPVPHRQASFAHSLPPRLHSYLISPGGSPLPNATSRCFV